MQLSITGKQIDIGNALRTHVQDRLIQSVGKYFDRPINGSVTFSRDGHEYRADCTVHLASGLHLQSQGRSTDIYASFDGAAQRMEKRLRRYKGRIRDHHNGARDAFAASPARERVIAGYDDDTSVEPDTLNPVIVSESATQLRTLTVGEAVMQLDLAETLALVFRNSAHGEINVVYRRADGNIGWIDAHAAKAHGLTPLSTTSNSVHMEIADILSPQAVFHRLKAANKKKLIAELAACAGTVAGLDEGKVFESLWEREKLNSTGVGHGIALPHARLSKLERIIGIFAQLENTVDFDAIDDAPVDLVFVLLTPPDAGADHLKALARVSRLMRNVAVCEKLRAANDRAQLYALLTEPTAGVQAA